MRQHLIKAVPINIRCNSHSYTLLPVTITLSMFLEGHTTRREIPRVYFCVSYNSQEDTQGNLHMTRKHTLGRLSPKISMGHIVGIFWCVVRHVKTPQVDCCGSIQSTTLNSSPSNCRKTVRIICSAELRVVFNIGSQWSAS